jgi:alpha-galactosidase
LCPAINEVRDYHRGLTERFIRDWEFDGNKLDFSYTVPPCYNPAHRHQSPQDSIRAVGDVYQTILQTTRALKLDSVTQVCPCGTTPSLAWLADFDQAVTADPVGSVQVRRRIKMYKALLGPEAPVYGDHVELTRVVGLDSVEKDLGRDFASTVGLGGVVGTKFTWPPDASQFQDARLTADKDAIWRKWIAIYNQKMLSSGSFRDLYVYGYDSPEGYAIEKDGRMYYAFFTDKPQMHAERIELRGLGRGHFHVVDYENGRDYGKLDGTDPHLEAKFQQHLLLEVSKIQP